MITYETIDSCKDLRDDEKMILRSYVDANEGAVSEQLLGEQILFDINNKARNAHCKTRREAVRLLNSLKTDVKLLDAVEGGLRYVHNELYEDVESPRRTLFRTVMEGGTSRVYTHLSEGICAIVSPCRGEYSEEENKSRMLRLKKEVRDRGYGFIQLTSRWVETDQETGQFATSDESSLLIPHMSFNEAVELGEKFEQSSVIVKDAEGCREICTTPFVAWDDARRRFNKGDVVRVFTTSGNHILNLEEAEAIFSRRLGGPASKPVGKGKAFRLKEVFECEEPRSSYFQASPTGIQIL